MEKRSTAVVMIIGVIVAGLLLAPAAVSAAGSVNRLFRQLRPKMDARYVERSDEAYALVYHGSPPEFDPVRTKNFVSVTNPVTGVYCLTPSAKIDLTNAVVVASPEYQSSSGDEVDVFWSNPANTSGCLDDDQQVEIYTYLNGTPTDNFSFSVFVPST